MNVVFFFRFLALSVSRTRSRLHYFTFPCDPFLFYRTKCSTQSNAAPLQVPPVVAAGVRLQQRGVPVVPVLVVVVAVVVVVVCAVVEWWPPSCSYGVLALIIQRWAAPPLVASITIRTVPWFTTHHPRTRTYCTLAGSRTLALANYRGRQRNENGAHTPTGSTQNEPNGTRNKTKPGPTTLRSAQFTQKTNANERKRMLLTHSISRETGPRLAFCVLCLLSRRPPSCCPFRIRMTWDGCCRMGTGFQKLSPGTRAPHAHSGRNRWR